MESRYFSWRFCYFPNSCLDIILSHLLVTSSPYTLYFATIWNFYFTKKVFDISILKVRDINLETYWPELSTPNFLVITKKSKSCVANFRIVSYVRSPGWIQSYQYISIISKYCVSEWQNSNESMEITGELKLFIHIQYFKLFGTTMSIVDIINITSLNTWVKSEMSSYLCTRWWTWHTLSIFTESKTWALY